MVYPVWNWGIDSQNEARAMNSPQSHHVTKYSVIILARYLIFFFVVRVAIRVMKLRPHNMNEVTLCRLWCFLILVVGLGRPYLLQPRRQGFHKFLPSIMGDHDNVCFLFNLEIVSLMSFLHQCDMLLVINLSELEYRFWYTNYLFMLEFRFSMKTTNRLILVWFFLCKFHIMVCSRRS